uniref:uncharacterized protein LOC120347491 isoform X1 n=2 Tax=Styela clava TaxID=7725 RepID=UPI0019393102|nr:uncharacterized protein LOC120347491 isoform X1 [Styela clava]
MLLLIDLKIVRRLDKMNGSINKRSEKLTETIFDDLKPGNECNIDCYSKHAKYYEEALTGIGYVVPRWCAEHSLKHVATSSENLKALDICVGTGLGAKSLSDLGFIGVIDAVDGNAAMLEEAKKKGIFRDLKQCIIKPDVPLPFEDETYDIAICIGAFSAGHIRAECIVDFFRILKKGGTFAFNTTNFHSDDNQANDDDLNKADQVIEGLIKDGVCELISLNICESMDRVSQDFKYIKGNIDKLRCLRKK